MADPRQPFARRQACLRRQLERTRQLDDLRCARALTPAETAEADALAHRLYMRIWRQRNRETFAAHDSRRRP